MEQKELPTSNEVTPLADHIHLYPNCMGKLNIPYPIYADVNAKYVGMLDNLPTFQCYDISGTPWSGHTFSQLKNFKPHLRPLSSITEEELKEVFIICYKSVYDHEPFDGIEYEYLSFNDNVGLKAKEHIQDQVWEYGLTIAGDVSFSANGAFLNTPSFEVGRYLLSKHFDLFNLIPDLAIDATTIEPA